MTVWIGGAKAIGSFDRYAERFDLLELRAQEGALPRTSRLAAWASSAPAGFRFAVALPPELASLEQGDAARGAHARVAAVARAVKAAWIVIRTGAAVRPSARSERGLQRLVAELAGLAPRTAWEPGGLWEDAHAEEVAGRLGVVRAVDLARRAPSGSIVYGRISRLGTAGRAGAATADRVAERLRDRDEAYVVVEPKGALGFSRLLRRALEEQAA